MKPADPRFRVLYAVWAFLEIIGFGGLIYGWGSLVYILKDEGLYMELCTMDNATLPNGNSSVLKYTATGNLSNVSVTPKRLLVPDETKDENNDSCDARDARLNLVFTIGSAMFCVGCFIMGQINYKFGTRITRVSAAQAKKQAKESETPPPLPLMQERVKKKTRKAVQDERSYWRERKRIQRASMSLEIKTAVAQRENERRRRQRKLLASSNKPLASCTPKSCQPTTALSAPLASSTPKSCQSTTAFSAPLASSTPNSCQPTTALSAPLASSTPKSCQPTTALSAPLASSTPKSCQPTTALSAPLASSTPKSCQPTTAFSAPLASSTLVNMETEARVKKHVSFCQPLASAATSVINSASSVQHMPLASSSPKSCHSFDPTLSVEDPKLTYSPSPTKDGKYSALKRVKKAIPKSKKSKLYIIKQLLKSFSPLSKQKIVKLSKCDLSVDLSEKKSCRRKRKDSDAKLQVISFYESSAVDIPSKKFYSKRLKKQRKVLDKPIAHLYKEFVAKFPNFKVSKRNFFKCRPKHILKMKSIKFTQCVCEICENMNLVHKHLRAAGSPYEKATDAAKATLCKHGEWPMLTCVDRTCKKCGVQHLSDELRSKCSLSTEITYQSWDQVADPRCKGKKTKLVTKTCKIDELIDIFVMNMKTFCSHQFVQQWQRHQFNALKKCLPPDHALIVLDFAENYTCQYQNQAQSAFYCLNQVTIHPVVVYSHCLSCSKMQTNYRLYISNDLQHDAHFVNHVLKDTLQSFPSKSFVVFSDNCSSQYKSRLPIFYFRQLAESFSIERCFFGERHGKSECDSVGGIVKTFLSQSVVSGRAILTSAEEIVHHLSQNFELSDNNCSHCKRTFHLVRGEEIKRTISSSDVPALKGIKKVHSLKFLSNGSLGTRHLSCFCNACLSGSYSKCRETVVLNFKEVDGFKLKRQKRKLQRVGGQEYKSCEVDDVGVLDSEIEDVRPRGFELDGVNSRDCEDEDVNPGDCEVEDYRVTDCGDNDDAASQDCRVDDVVKNVETDFHKVGEVKCREEGGIENGNGLKVHESEKESCECREDEGLKNGAQDEDCETDSDGHKSKDISVQYMLDEGDVHAADEVVHNKNVCSSLHTSNTFKKPVKRQLFGHLSSISDTVVFTDFYNDIQRCTSFEELSFICKNQRLAPLSINPAPFKINLDRFALKLLPPNSPHGYLPNLTVGDGNCLPRSLSTLVFGTEKKHMEIRCRIIHELVINKDLYLDKDFLSLGCDVNPDFILPRIASLSESLSGVSIYDFEKVLEIEIFQTRLLGRYLGPWHLHAAAQILQRGIVSLYPMLGPPQNRELIARAYVPQRFNSEETLYILWTSNRQDMRKDHWVANHVVPMVKMFNILFVIGALLIAFTSNEVPWLIFPGLSFIGGAGITYLMTNMQISLLFPKIGSVVVGVFCGAFDASTGTQLLVKFGHEGGISRQTSYLIMAVAHLFTLVSTFFFLPKDFIKKPSPIRRPDENFEDEKDKEATVKIAGNGSATEPDLDDESVRPSLASQMLSLTYMLHVYWLSVLQLRFYFLLGSLNTMLENMLDSKDEVSRYTNETTYILMCGLFTSPLAGAFYALQSRFFAHSLSPLRRNMMPTVLPLALTTVIGILMSAIILVEKASVIYAVFVCLLFFRSFLYTMGAGLLSAIFPSEYFGIMYGIMFILSGVVSMLQYGLFAWAEATGFFQVNVFLLVLMFTTFCHPLYQWWASRKAERALSF